MNIEQAKILYNKEDNECKAIALAYFSVEELEGKGLVRTWEELQEVSGWWVSPRSSVETASDFPVYEDGQNIFKTEAQAQAAIALAMLSQIVADAEAKGGIEKHKEVFKENFSHIIKQAQPLLTMLDFLKPEPNSRVDNKRSLGFLIIDANGKKIGRSGFVLDVKENITDAFRTLESAKEVFHSGHSKIIELFIDNVDKQLSIDIVALSTDEGVAKIQQEGYLLGMFAGDYWGDGVVCDFDTMLDRIKKGSDLMFDSLENAKLDLDGSLHDSIHKLTVYENGEFKKQIVYES